MSVCTESIHVDNSPERVAAFLQDVHNLPRWTEFFRSVGEPVGDRWEVRTAMGTTMCTRIDRTAAGRYVISSLVGEREERAALTALPEDGGTRVSFTVKVLPALFADHHGDDGARVQRDRMRDELRRLRSAVTRTDVSVR